MKGLFTMSNKEVNRIPIMEKLIKKGIKQRKAAKILGLSVRQVGRLKKRYKREGTVSLIHKSRGRISNHKILDDEINRVIEIVKDRYYDFGPTFALEKLKKYHQVTLGRETLRKAMIKAEIWKPKRRRIIKLHQMRPRREQEGELVQIDGSPHPWFEDRGTECTLLVFIDDATGKLLWLEFVESETTDAYFKATESYLRIHGKPLAFYSDKHGIFRINTRRGGISAVEDSNGLTQFARAMEELNIKLISANTPQAKGRVERVNETLQDRLVKELRLRGINTLKEANKYLPDFIKEFNRRFAVQPKNSKNAHQPLLSSEKLEEILIRKYTRVLSKNLELQYKNILYQIQTERPSWAMRNAKVTITEDRLGNIKIYYKGSYPKAKELKYKTLSKNPKSEIINSKILKLKIDTLKKQQQEATNNIDQLSMPKWKPASDHPWRQYTYAN